LAFTGRCTPRVPEARKKSQKKYPASVLNSMGFDFCSPLIDVSQETKEFLGSSLIVSSRANSTASFFQGFADTIHRVLLLWQFFWCSQLSPSKTIP